MQEAVLTKIGGLGEALVANLALIGPFTSVCNMVPCQVSLGDKGLSTLRALERSLPSVCSQVVAYVHQLLKLFAACGALVLAFQNVHHPLVPHHSDVSRK